MRKKKKKKKPLEQKQKLFIMLGSVLLVVFTVGMYVNSQMNNLNHAWTRSASSIAEIYESGALDPEVNLPNKPEFQTPSARNSWSYERLGETKPLTEEELPSFKQIAQDVQSRVSKPIEKTDMLRVGLMLVRRLDRTEITYLYNVGKRGIYSQGEVAKTRNILTTKLTTNDRKVLEEMAEKYNQPLFFMGSE